MGRSDRNGLGVAAKNSVFLGNLEEWIEEQISRNSHGNEELLKIVRQKFERSILANIEYHEFMASRTTEANDGKAANRHKLLAEIYRSFVAGEA